MVLRLKLELLLAQRTRGIPGRLPIQLSAGTLPNAFSPAPHQLQHPANLKFTVETTGLKNLGRTPEAILGFRRCVGTGGPRD